MTKVLLIAFAILAAAAIDATAETRQHEIAIPDLCRFYEISLTFATADTAFVAVPDEFTHIVSARMRFTGEADIGSVICHGPDTHLEDWGIRLLCSFHDAEADYYWLTDLEFVADGVATLDSHLFYGFGPVYGEPGSLDFLIGNTVRIICGTGYGSYDQDCGYYETYQTVDVTDARLILTVESPTPVSTTPWGSIKAMFR